MGLLDSFRSKKRQEDTAAKLYVACVDQARSPAFFLDMGVPDTVDGRFDLIILHTMLLIRRLRLNGAEAAAVSQSVLNLMFADMDRNLREMGVGDLSVGKQVKKMAKAFYGRSETWEKSLDDDDSSLAGAFKDTIFRAGEADPNRLRLLAAYTRETDEILRGQDLADLLSGLIDFTGVGTKLEQATDPAA